MILLLNPRQYSQPLIHAFVYTTATMRAERDAQAAPMQSQVNWALLGLVIQRPSYAYELARRFERTYEGVLTLSSVSHAYTALATLRKRGLVEELPGTRVGRQPKPHYRATPKGLEGYRQWLVDQVDEDLRRQRLLVLALATFARVPHAALEILTRYEQACLADAQRTPLPAGACAGGAPALAARLAAEESRLAVGAKLAWVQYARQELNALADLRGVGR
jgi:DNA-binding PadR family transcriptional regulator